MNCWGAENMVEMLALKIDPHHWSALKPFLLFTKAIENTDLTGIELDPIVVEALRNL